jgi:hypothetical protein
MKLYIDIFDFLNFMFDLFSHNRQLDYKLLYCFIIELFSLLMFALLPIIKKALKSKSSIEIFFY